MIAARDVSSIAPDDCVLFLWATVPVIEAALYKPCSVGQGSRQGGLLVSELLGILFVGRRGNVRAQRLARNGQVCSSSGGWRAFSKAGSFVRK